MSYTILVLGIGRCGTSTVARILHERIGIKMCRFCLADKANPRGYYEDPWFLDLDISYNRNTIDRRHYQLWVLYHIIRRNKTEGTWGLKHPQSLNLDWAYLPFLENPIIIRCVRDRWRVIQSFRKKNPKVFAEEGGIESFVDRISSHQTRVCSKYKHLSINFNSYQPEAELEKRLHQYLQDHGVELGNPLPKAQLVSGYQLDDAEQLKARLQLYDSKNDMG